MSKPVYDEGDAIRLWLYTDASIAGAAVIDEDANGPWPLGPGRYSAYLLEDDGDKKLAGAPFTVR
jgi:hypothetical protein